MRLMLFMVFDFICQHSLKGCYNKRYVLENGFKLYRIFFYLLGRIEVIVKKIFMNKIVTI